jgi:hypothetical protein
MEKELKKALQAATSDFYANCVDDEETRKPMVYADMNDDGFSVCVIVDVRYEDDAFGGLCIGELGEVDAKIIADCIADFF